MSDGTKKERGERIEALRREAGLTLEALAKDIGVKYQSIAQWEKGATSPSVDNVGKLSVRFGVHPTWLWSGQGPKHIINKLSSHDQEYVDKLISILKSKNQQAINSIKTNVDVNLKYCSD
ncbi:MAG: helix-turn-helix domain-containing protein [Deltaproteobacteria bacterium]|nr:helix-turn-helix domain-containing protein [Deltaproteobacteria bacterium]